MNHLFPRPFITNMIIRYVHTSTYLLAFVIERFCNYSFSLRIESYCRKQFCATYMQAIVGHQGICYGRHSLRPSKQTVNNEACWNKRMIQILFTGDKPLAGFLPAGFFTVLLEHSNNKIDRKARI